MATPGLSILTPASAMSVLVKISLFSVPAHCVLLAVLVSLYQFPENAAPNAFQVSKGILRVYNICLMRIKRFIF